MRLVHLSDLHLGFRAYGQTERGWNQRERDVAAAFRWALQETVRLEPDLVLITGDLFDHPSPPSTAFLTIHRGVTHLRAHLPAVPILIIAGERDTPRNPADPGPIAVLDALPGVEAAAGAPRAVRFRGSGLHALLLPFRAVARPPHPDVRPDPAARWNLLLIRARPTDTTSGVRVDPDDWSYVAVGGPHRHQAWASNVRASGALERPASCPWREATEEKGFLSVDLEEGSAEFHPVPGRPVVDLAPVRVSGDDLESGTRRIRELLQGVPGGIEGKILRMRLRGDVIAPNEGVSQGLLDAVRRRSAYLEAHVDNEDATPPDSGSGAWMAAELSLPGSPTIKLRPGHAGPGITLITSALEADRIAMVEALRGDRGEARGGPSFREGLELRPHIPDDPVTIGLWAGGEDPGALIQTIVPRLIDSDGSPGGSAGPTPTSSDGARSDASLAGLELEGRDRDIGSMEAALTNRRADWVEATGDLEAATLQWAQERQDADSKLQAYRDRAGELRTRIRMLESEREEASCPTCGRRLGAEYEGLLDTLQGEWENVVQDGRWWKRRREQLDEKPEDLQQLEEHALRLQVQVEEAAEVLDRARTSGFPRSPDRSGGEPSLRDIGGSEPLQLVSAEPELRAVARLAGNYLSRITEGRVVGVSLEAPLGIVTAEGVHRPPAGAERAAFRLAVHLALWARGGLATRPGSLLIWELHESGSEILIRGTLELLSDLEPFRVPILFVAPPSALDSPPEPFAQVVELSVNEEGRRELRSSEIQSPRIILRTGAPATEVGRAGRRDEISGELYPGY